MIKKLKKAYLNLKSRLIENKCLYLDLKRVKIDTLFKDLRYNRINSMIVTRSCFMKEEIYSIIYLTKKEKSKKIILNKDQFDKFNKKMEAKKWKK